MAFIYDFEYKVHSVIEDLADSGLPVGEPEISITTTDGFMKCEGGEYLLTYAEKTEDGDRIFTEIRVAEGRIALTRRGAIASEMIFSSERYKALYNIGAYSFDMELETKKIRSSLTKEGGELQLIYIMTVGGAARSVRMKLTATPKRRQNARA